MAELRLLGKMFVHSHYLKPNPSLHGSYAVGLSPTVLRKSGAETPSDLSVCNLQTWALESSAHTTGMRITRAQSGWRAEGWREAAKPRKSDQHAVPSSDHLRQIHVCTSTTDSNDPVPSERAERAWRSENRCSTPPSPGQYNENFPPRTRQERHRCALRHLCTLELTQWRASLLTCNLCRYSLHSRIDTADGRARPEKSSTPLSPPPPKKMANAANVISWPHVFKSWIETSI